MRYQYCFLFLSSFFLVLWNFKLGLSVQGILNINAGGFCYPIMKITMICTFEEKKRCQSGHPHGSKQKESHDNLAKIDLRREVVSNPQLFKLNTLELVDPVAAFQFPTDKKRIATFTSELTSLKAIWNMLPPHWRASGLVTNRCKLSFNMELYAAHTKQVVSTFLKPS